MHPETHHFKTITEFINHLKGKDKIIGIIEYGSRSYLNMNPGGDYDLALVFNTRVSENYNGLHFHIARIPVDCMMISASEEFDDNPANPVLALHTNAKILFDRDGRMEKLLERITEKWNSIKRFPDRMKIFYRFLARHTLDKLKYRLHDHVLFSYYLISLTANMLLDCYSEINQYEPGKPIELFRIMKEKDIDLYHYYTILYTSKDLDELYHVIEKAGEYILLPVDGPWKTNEILFHLSYAGKEDKQEQSDMIKYLLE